MIRFCRTYLLVVFASLAYSLGAQIVPNGEFLQNDTLCIDNDQLSIAEKSMLRNDQDIGLTDSFKVWIDTTFKPNHGKAELSRYELSEIWDLPIIGIDFYDTVTTKYSYINSGATLDSVRYVVHDFKLGQQDSAWVYFDIGCATGAEAQRINCTPDSILYTSSNSCVVDFDLEYPEVIRSPGYILLVGSIVYADASAVGVGVGETVTISDIPIGEYDRFASWGLTWAVNADSVDGCEVYLIVEDTISPEIFDCPLSIIKTVLTNSSVVTWASPSFADNCSLSGFSRTDTNLSFISGSNFPLGLTSIEYTAIDSSGNESVCSFDVEIKLDPSWDGIPSDICQSSDSIDLTAINRVDTRGRFYIAPDTVNAITYLNPKMLTAGSYELLHVVRLNGVPASDTSVFTIADSVDAEFTGLDSIYCASSSPLSFGSLTTTQTGGTWYIDTDTAFMLPLDSGRYEVSHVLDNGVCLDSVGLSIQVDVVNADFDGLDTLYCAGSNTISFASLTTVQTGGTWYLGTDNTALGLPLSSGSYEVSHVIDNGVCSDSVSLAIQVDLLDAQWSALSPTYCKSENSIQLSDFDSVGTWLLDDLPVIELVFSSLALGNHEVSRVLTNEICADTFSLQFELMANPDASWEPFPSDILCKYASPISVDSLGARLSSQSVVGYWTVNDQRILGELDLTLLALDVKHSLRFDSDSLEQCRSTEVHDLFINEGDNLVNISDEVCDDTIIVSNLETENRVWVGQTNGLVIDDSLDSVLFVDLDFGESSVALVELEGYKCLNVTSFDFYMEEQSPSINLGENINLERDEFDFSIDGGSIPEGYAGKWSFDPLVLSVSDEQYSLIDVTVLKPDTSSLIWELESDLCESVSDTILVIKKDFRVSGGVSPNGDGLNDYFMILGAPDGKVNINVINRWGQTVYESEDYKNDWGGTSQNGKLLPTDVYYYTVRFENGEVEKGVVALKE